MSTHGPFTDNNARLFQVGGVPKGDDATFTDTYAFTMPEGGRPSQGTVSGLPSIGSAATGAASAYEAKQITFRQDDARSLVWFADVEYRKKSSTSSTEEFGRVVSRTWGSKTVARDLVVDARGKSVSNGAGDPFENVPQQDIVVPSIQIVAQRASSPVDLIVEYSGTVNRSTVTVAGITIAPHCGRITITGRDSGDEDYPYEVVYDVDITTNLVGGNTTLEGASADYATSGDLTEIGWDVALLNVGYYYIHTDGGSVSRKLRFYDNLDSEGVDANGVNHAGGSDFDPGELQASTTPLPIGVAGEDRRQYGQYSLVFERYRDADWSGLRLPTA